MKITPLSLLLATTFLSTSAVAQTVPTTNADYLNSLTGDKVTWEEVTASGENTVGIDGKYYKFTYNNTGNYTETSTRIDDTLASANVTAVVFNSITSSEDGGAIYNRQDNSNVDIKADFINNSLSYAGHGGAIYNGNYTNTAIIGSITGDFIANHLLAIDSMYPRGSAIANEGGTIGNITGNFVANYITSNDRDRAYGIVIHNVSVGGKSIYGTGGIINNIKGNFIGNYSINTSAGGTIYNGGTIKNIEAKFIGNEGGINNVRNGTIDNISGDFINNKSAISNSGIISNITGDFISNSGGAVYNSGTIDYISGSFINNYTKQSGDDGKVFGGAVYTTGDLTFKADGKNYYFSGNYVEDNNGIKTNNAIWVQNSNTSSHPILKFELTKGGSFVFDDGIDGGYYYFASDAGGRREIFEQDGYGYNLNITGDVCESCFANSITFNDRINNVHDLTLDTTQMVLGKNAYVEVTNNYIARNNPLLRVEVDLADNKAGKLFVDGNIYGKTNVIVDTKNYKDVRGEESIVFAQSNGDIYLDGESGAKAETEEEKAQAFSVLRVVGSPYMWNVEYEDGGVEKIWSLAMHDTENTYTEDCDETPEEPEPVIPDEPIQPLGPIQVAPEIIGFETLPNAGLAQTNGMVYNIMRKVGISKLYCKGCGFYDYNWDGEAFHNVWVDTTYNGLTIEAPVEIDAKVWGIEAGSDLQHDLNNKLGIFVSYRQGNYEMDGKGEKYYSNIGSEIDIDSYLAGLYYRYDYNDWYAFATVYGGMQNAKIKTDDGVSADTDGIEFGGSIEAGYNYALTRKLSVTPSLGAFYSQISYDDATDNVGKTVNYNDLKQVELEAGAKFAYTQYTDDGFYSLYVKPSVVQTLVDGDEINITEIGKVDTVEDKTLGRVELGGNIGFNDNWSAYGWANYTFGSDYEATSLGLGLNYAW